MASTRKFDKLIQATASKLAAVRSRDTAALPVGDQAKLAGLGVVVVAKATRLKSSPAAERGAERIWTGAESKLQAELAAAQAAKAAVLAEEAAAKVAKKSSGWF
ncbi:hypothetical protein [Streptomyces niveus]|uniref:hypothetical protein n=1 Tax=Streptomyces niveus TaxID=193462 RepID=UPI0003C5A791|nr:hypothetical protein [Streptomyces niveus]EST17860.1 hypothetical protein M877_40085 [Streptomyces niveus NCIMB 11891]